MFRKVLILLVLAAMLATVVVAQTGQKFSEFDVVVPGNDEALVWFYPKGVHLQMSTATGDITLRFREIIRNTTGDSTGLRYNPGPVGFPVDFDGVAFPDTADTNIALVISTTKYWNVFNDINADGAYFVNANGSQQTIRVQMRSD